MDFKAMPKIELHAHLTGSITRHTLHEIWLTRKAAGETDLEDPLVVMPEGKHDFNLTTFFPLFTSYIYNLLTTPAAITHSTLAVLQSFAADGVAYLELRTTPRAIPSSDISKEDYVALILSTIREFEAQSPPPGMHTRLILSIDRRNTLPQALDAVSLAAKYRSTNDVGVVGVDLCGDPTVLPDGGITLFAPAFQEARQRGLGITLHFGEAECSGTEAEIRTLLSWEPDRLGHVIHLDEEAKKEIAQRRIGLELCLSCNVHAGMVKGGFEGHHFGEWWGVERSVISLGTDDVGVFGSELSNEYRLVAHHFKLSEAQVRELARRGIDAIFGGEAEKKRLRSVMWI